MIEITQVIYEFHNKETDTTNGVYCVKLNGKPHVFIRNDNSVGAVCHYLSKSASECVSIIRDDVKQDFLEQVALMEE
uniref:Uncharacterized protein n=1 Tax=viral metagenome TaxID=1070528 RepID=A0A6M3LML2_9ZZZZ